MHRPLWNQQQRHYMQHVLYMYMNSNKTKILKSRYGKAIRMVYWQQQPTKFQIYTKGI
jgi:hypothetical protein